MALKHFILWLIAYLNAGNVFRHSPLLPFCFWPLGGRTESDELPPTTLLIAGPELPPLLPMPPSPLPGAKPPIELGDIREEPSSSDWPEPKPSMSWLIPATVPSRPPVEDVGPPTAALPPPMASMALLVVEVLTPPREPGRLELAVPEAAA